MPKRRTVIEGIDETIVLEEPGSHVHVYLNEKARRNFGGMIDEIVHNYGNTWLITDKVHNVQVKVNGVTVSPGMWETCTVLIETPAEMVVSRERSPDGKKVVVRREEIED